MGAVTLPTTPADQRSRSARRSWWTGAVRAAVKPRSTGLDAGVVIFLVAVLLFHLQVYGAYPYKPIAPNTGGENFWDQGQYLKSAAAFARGELSADQHWYPTGYALLVAPFV